MIPKRCKRCNKLFVKNWKKQANIIIKPIEIVMGVIVWIFGFILGNLTTILIFLVMLYFVWIWLRAKAEKKAEEEEEENE